MFHNSPILNINIRNIRLITMVQINCPGCGKLYDNSYGRKRCAACNLQCRRDRNAIYRASTRDSRKIYDLNRYAEKKEDILAYHRKHYQENKEAIKKYVANYTKNNKEKCNASRRKLYNSNPNVKMRSILSKRLKRVLKNIKLEKSSSTLKLLGCTIDDFRLWIEWQFTDDMNWENHGAVWHVDHVIPCALFDQTDVNEQEKCWHWSNMQPLLGPDNLSKGSETTKEEQQRQLDKIKDFVEEHNDEISDEMSLLDYDRFVYVGMKPHSSVLNHADQSDGGSGENSEVEEKSEL